jgi:hypothetical protein
VLVDGFGQQRTELAVGGRSVLSGRLAEQSGEKVYGFHLLLQRALA